MTTHNLGELLQHDADGEQPEEEDFDVTAGRIYRLHNNDDDGEGIVRHHARYVLVTRVDHDAEGYIDNAAFRFLTWGKPVDGWETEYPWSDIRPLPDWEEARIRELVEHPERHPALQQAGAEWDQRMDQAERLGEKINQQIDIHPADIVDDEEGCGLDSYLGSGPYEEPQLVARLKRYVHEIHALEKRMAKMEREWVLAAKPKGKGRRKGA